jgi:hypothetical protein
LVLKHSYAGRHAQFKSRVIDQIIFHHVCTGYCMCVQYLVGRRCSICDGWVELQLWGGS